MRRSATGIQITTLTKMMIRSSGVPRADHPQRLQCPGLAAWPLGVGGIAVSFALKTLRQRLLSFYVSCRQLHRGTSSAWTVHRSFVEGYVMDIHWRITLLTLDNNMVLIPNSSSPKPSSPTSASRAPLSVSIPMASLRYDIALLDESCWML